MARRRKADADAADAALIVNPEAAAEAASPNADPESSADNVSATPPETVAQRPRRAHTRRKIAASAEVTPVEDIPVPETPAAETEANDAAEIPQVAGAPAAATQTVEATPEKSRRTPRRRAGKSDAPSRDEANALLVGMTADLSLPIAETPESEPAPQETRAEVLADTQEDTTDELPETPLEAKPGRSARRRSARRTKNEAAQTAAAETAAPVKTASGKAPAPAPVSEKATPAAGSKVRLRGQRPPRSSEPTLLAAPTLTEVIPVVLSLTEEADASETGKRRTRGLRKIIKKLVPVSVAAPLTAVEPPSLRYQPLPAETLARLAQTQIVLNKNQPEFVVNGEPRLPLWLFVNTEDAETRTIAITQVRLAYEAGVRFFSVLAHLPWKTRSGERRYEPLDEALQLIADNAPDAFILPRLLFSPPGSWIRAHEDDMTVYPDGETGDVSLASRAFWEEEADAALRAAVEHVAEGNYAGRVFGFYLEHGEWFYEKGRGFDRSEANVNRFRDWLKERYRNNQVALRSAWFDGAVTFDSADIPDWPTPDGLHFFLSARERRYADYNEYASDLVAQVITGLGKAVKEASGDRSAVAVSYGYTLELMRPGSGHLSLASVLESPFVDILTGPVSYTARTPGGSAPLPAPLDSIRLAGKLWVSEDDTKTHLSLDDTPDTYNPKIDTLEGTLAVHNRNFGAALAHGAGVSFMDLWGQGWLADRALWQNIARLRQIGERLAEIRRAATTPVPEPDVAVFVDERSFFNVRGDEGLLDELIAQHRDALLRSGARVGFYLMSDLLKENFPKTPRLFLFLNAFRLSDDMRLILRNRYQNDGRTLAWMYGPGASEESVTEIADAIGMTLQLQPWGSRTGTQISSPVRSPLTEALRGEKLGDEARLNPSYYVADPRAQILGEYVHTGCASLAVRKHPRWQSVFIGERSLPLALLRGLYRLAGVPIYTVDDDVAAIGENFILLHSAPGGGTSVFLPESGALGDALTGEALAADGFGARLSMPPRGTRLLIFGSTEMLASFGVDARYAPHGLTQSELPPAPPPFAFEATGDLPTPQIPADAAPEDVALFEAALESDFSVADKEDGAEDAPDEAQTADASAETEAEKKKRRRRRRRGRGKGVLEVDEILDGAESDDMAEDEAEASDALLETPEIQETPVTPTEDIPAAGYYDRNRDACAAPAPVACRVAAAFRRPDREHGKRRNAPDP